MDVLTKIRSKTARIGIVGLGYVGLPLLVAFANAGFVTVGFDVDKKKRDSIRRGISYIGDVPSSDLSRLVAEGRILASTDESILASVDVAIICVPTPLKKSRDPDISFIELSVAAVARQVPEGALVVLESTTYPGTTREVVVPALTLRGGVVGSSIFVAFSPERVDPGNKVYHTRNTPKVVGGVTPSCLRIAVALYETIVEQVVSVSSPEAAEMTKLLENTYRAVNIGLANEFALLCDKLGIDVWEVIDAAKTKPFGFSAFYPGPGLGGHCIPIDPLYLSWKMRSLNTAARFIELADAVNSSMPEHVVLKTIDALSSIAHKPARGARVLISGVAYKRDVSDVRESPALEVIASLEKRGAHVDYLDPWVPSFSDHGVERTSVKDDVILSFYDAVIILTDHKAIDHARIVAEASLVIDTRNATRQHVGPGVVVRL